MAPSSARSTDSPTRQPIVPVQAPRRIRRRRKALTLIEMLVSVTLTLLVVFAIVQVFEFLGDSVSLGRATIEMAGQMRSVAHRLQLDLDNRTCPVKPWVDPGSGLGYFEIIDGEARDNSPGEPLGVGPNAFLDAATNPLGDRDDVLAMTVKSSEKIYGTYDGQAVTSSTAEVIWYAVVPQGAVFPTLIRRTFLIRPDLDPFKINAMGSEQQQIENYFANNNVSVRWDATNKELVPNSLTDLATRNHRAHVWLRQYDASIGSRFFPGFIDSGFTVNTETGGRHVTLDELGTDFGEWIVLSDVTAFDVRVYDPEAPVRQPTASNLALVPGDAGYSSVPPANTIGLGAFSDLGYAAFSATATTLGDNIDAGSLKNAQFPSGYGAGTFAYDTWSLGYERDGIDQDDDGLTDEGFDGIDNDAMFGVDDYGERETAPPYNAPLRGIEVKIRMIEVGTQQVRQVSVIGDFTDF